MLSSGQKASSQKSQSEWSGCRVLLYQLSTRS